MSEMTERYVSKECAVMGVASDVVCIVDVRLVHLKPELIEIG